MKIALAWLADYLGSPDALKKLQEQSDVLNQRMPLAGLEVESRKKLSEGIEEIITAEIISHKQHPDADRLNVCEVRVSDKEAYSIVCGAPNVRDGMKVALAREGCVLPGNFKIKKSKIRGVESSGMLCSESELGISDESDGILDLPAETPTNKKLIDVLGLNDEVWEFELTPDRADCLSHIGLAREVGRYIGSSMTLPKYEEIDLTKTSGVPLISLEVQAKKACPFYSAQLLEDFSTIKTAAWMKSRLKSIGQRSHNALVDITNFVLMELGQPMHAFDADKVVGSKIIVRFARKGEKLTTLDGVNRDLCKEDLVIADSSGPIALAGVMGGQDSAVTENTKRIILESAYFHPDVIRGTVQRYKLHSDSSHRFERGVDPSMALVAAGRAVHLYKEMTSCRRKGALVHFQAKSFAKKLEAHSINFDLRAFRKVTGLDLDAKVISDHLATLGIRAEAKSAKVLKIFVPTHRIDLLREIDLIEEVARLSGFDRIPTRFPPMLQATESLTEGTYERIQKIRSRMLSSSYVELMPYCFFSEDEKAYAPSASYVELENPLSQDWRYMRSNLCVGLLRSLAASTSKGEYRAKFFETSMVYEKRKDEAAVKLHSPCNESLHTSWVLMGQRNAEHWSTDKSSGARKESFDFFDAKAAAEVLIQTMAVKDKIWKNLNSLPLWKVQEDSKHLDNLANNAPWIPLKLLHPGKSAIYFTPGRAGPFSDIRGFVGEIHPIEKEKILNVATGKQLSVAFGEFRCVEDLWSKAYEKSSDSKILKSGSVVASSRFPAVERDLAFVFNSDVEFLQVKKIIEKEAAQHLIDLECIDVYPMDDKVSLAFRLTLQSTEKTLEDKEVNELIDRTTKQVTKKLNAELRN